MLEAEVPEIQDGLITIHKIARIPGERAKIAVESYDDFKKIAPLYGREKKEASYAVWENQLRGSGMSLERYVEILSAADADKNSSLKQAELGYALRDAIARNEMSYAQAAAVWAAQGWTRTFDYWNSKN